MRRRVNCFLSGACSKTGFSPLLLDFSGDPCTNTHALCNAGVRPATCWTRKARHSPDLLPTPGQLADRISKSLMPNHVKPADIVVGQPSAHARLMACQPVIWLQQSLQMVKPDSDGVDGCRVVPAAEESVITSNPAWAKTTGRLGQPSSLRRLLRTRLSLKWTLHMPSHRWKDSKPTRNLSSSKLPPR